MPYIESRERRAVLYPQATPRDPGELNYAITALVDVYLGGRYGECADAFNYQRVNDVIGALECAKQEAYRRIVAPYEDQKIIDNGEVYECRS